MSALKTLWNRAPQWRFLIYVAIFFTTMSVLFPTPWMVGQAPWLTRLPGVQLPASRVGTEPNASPPVQNASSQDQTQDDTNRLVTPDITTSLTGSLPFAGHTLPLPAGVWHPVLSGQIGPRGMMIVNILARTDRGIVTGVMIARTATEPLPAQIVQEAANNCHDDRNYTSHIVTERPDGQLECAYIANALVGPNGAISTDELIQLAFKRLSALGFPLPSLFVVANWLQSYGANDTRKGSTLIFYLFSPVKPGTVDLLAPLPYWDKRMLVQAPTAEAFVHKTDRWLTHWLPLLRQDITNDINMAALSPELAHDPAAP